jgi:hypothetical protein
MNISNCGLGLLLSFYYSWSLTLLVLGFAPFMIICGYLQTKMLSGFSAKDKENLEEAGQVRADFNIKLFFHRIKF